MYMKNLDGLLRDELHRLIGIETAAGPALTKMAKATTTPTAKAEINRAIAQCATHLRRLDLAITSIDGVPEAKACMCVEAMTECGNVVASDECDAHTRDARSVGMAGVLLSYGLARYEVALAYARALDYETVVHVIAESIEGIQASMALLAEHLDGVSKTAAEATSVRQPPV